MQAPRPSPLEIAWIDAPRAIRAVAATRPSPVLIGITGPVASGKSTLAAALGACVISTDSYLPDYDRVEALERDLPHQADLFALAAHLDAIRRGLAVDVPVWSYQTHRREGTRRVEPAPLVVVEGIHALHETLSARLDLRVFVDAPADARWRRWEIIESAGQRGMGVEAARRHFDLIAEPTFARFAGQYRRSADFLVLNP